MDTREAKIERMRKRMEPVTVVPLSHLTYAIYRIEMTPQGVETSRKRIERWKREEVAEQDALDRNIKERSDAIYVVLKEKAA